MYDTETHVNLAAVADSDCDLVPFHMEQKKQNKQKDHIPKLNILFVQDLD